VKWLTCISTSSPLHLTLPHVSAHRVEVCWAIASCIKLLTAAEAEAEAEAEEATTTRSNSHQQRRVDAVPLIASKLLAVAICCLEF